MNALATRQRLARDISPKSDRNVIQWHWHAAPRVVLDTSILVAAIRSAAGASRVLLRAALERRYCPLASTALLFEYEAVVLRPEHLRSAGLTPRDALALLDAYAAVAEFVPIDFSVRPAVEAPKDDMVLEAAVNGGATMIVTLDRTIQRAPSFGIPIFTPQRAMRKLHVGT